MPKAPSPASPIPAQGSAHLLPIRLFLGAACFLSGASMMVIEISAARLLSPLFGNSVYTWTALIGVILIAFSVGGYWGGRLADKRAGLDVLGWLLAGVAILTFFIPALSTWFGPSFAKGGLIDGPVMFSLFLLAVPGALLGAISPAAVRLYSLTSSDSHIGGAAGTISMLGSLGSFVGTFLSGFFLLGNFGVRSIFVGTAVLLLALAVLAFILSGKRLAQSSKVIAFGLGAGLIGALTSATPAEGVIYEHESFYHRIQVIEEGVSPNRRRFLKLDSTYEGGMNADTGALVMDYQHYWRLAMLQERPIQSALFIGAGAFGMPEEVSRTFPDATVDVAELDPEVIKTGRQFFKLDEHPKVHAHAGDARHYLRTSGGQKWDLIFGDAYNGKEAIPAHLASKEFFQLVSDHLTPEGVYTMNVISAVQGDKSELLAGMLATLREVFPHLEVFAVGSARNIPQNVIILASHHDLSKLIADQGFLANTWQARLLRTHIPRHLLPVEGQVFTDNFNPVDAIIARGLMR
ncbi:spermine/spermidine synthase [Prosthecobacter fusiformis]|uniref:Spermine/spermidine synthase n=1 Tax=Prosthecobacter fusiformis TaxID=48464 RepID=A0A4R7RY16_9BACT|nr:fused MFS/spermidine synthase [Prosthecobacter fusiformis]TDU70732.1 spermine/spermidine synthase [Prosthecobacter fusiformis]